MQQSLKLSLKQERKKKIKRAHKYLWKVGNRPDWETN